MSLLKSLGPGLITACAAIGISHFAQATRAGGYFGFDLLWLILAAHIAKYPFIEFGNRYTSATGENFLVGYWRFNKPVFYLITAISACVATFTLAAAGFICAGIIKAIVNTPLSTTSITALILGLCTAIISIGHYKLLDKAMKVFIVLLSFTTLIAVILAAKNFTPLPESEIFYSNYSPFESRHIPFLIALMGFMPGPIELSIWHSLWLKARNLTKDKLNFKQAQFDFNVGYAIMAVTAILFLSIGALMINNSASEIPNKSAGFARLLIDSYTASIGSWAAPIVSISILAAMFSTVLALVDSYPRVLTESLLIIKGEMEKVEETAEKPTDGPSRIKIFKEICSLFDFEKRSVRSTYSSIAEIKNGQISKKIVDSGLSHRRRLIHSSLMVFYSITATLAIMFLFDNFKQILDFSASVAFIVAPIYAFVNYKIVTSNLLPEEFRPGLFLRILSWFGLIFLIGFLGWFLWVKLFVI